MVKMYCAIRLTGRNSTQGVRALPKIRKNATSTGRPRRKWTMLVVTTMIGSTSTGNLIFLISAPCTERTLADSSSEEENQVQGRMPLNRNRA